MYGRRTRSKYKLKIEDFLESVEDRVILDFDTEEMAMKEYRLLYNASVSYPGIVIIKRGTQIYLVKE